MPGTLVVLSDTSGLQYLHQLGHLPLLPAIYGRIHLPPAVAAEISAGRLNGVSLPVLGELDWVEIRQTPRRLPSLANAKLGAGEVELLSLASENPGCLVILDDALARRYAGRLGVRFTGTLGVLLEAKRRGFIPAIRPLIDNLTRLGFRLSSKTEKAVLHLAAE